MDLRKGILSESILKAAGHGIQTEVSQKTPENVKPGQIIGSSGGHKWKKIYHAHLPEYEQGTGQTQKVSPDYYNL